MPTHSCKQCRALFNSQRARRLHRSGPPNASHCLDPEAMKRKGMTQNCSAKWLAPSLPAASLADPIGSTAGRFARTASRFS